MCKGSGQIWSSEQQDCALSGTIPDEEPLDASSPDGSEAPAVLVDELDDGDGASHAAAVPWDRYFDEARDVRLEHRGGVFRCPPNSALAVLTCGNSFSNLCTVFATASAGKNIECASERHCGVLQTARSGHSIAATSKEARCVTQ